MKSIPSLVVVSKKKEDMETSKCIQMLSTTLPSLTVLKQVLKKCMNWEQGEAIQRLSDAIDEWLEGRGRALDKGSKKVKLLNYCELFNIMLMTLAKYVTKTQTNKPKLLMVKILIHVSSGA